MADKKVRGTVVYEKYVGRKLVEKEVRPDQILNVKHWKGWQDGDKRVADSTRLSKNFDYKNQENIMTTYSIRKGNERVVYKTDFKKPIYKK